MALIDTINAKATGRTPEVRVVLDSQPVDSTAILSASSRFSAGQLIGEGECVLTAVPAWYAPGQEIELWAGWNGEVESVFRGQVFGDGQELEDGSVKLHAQGTLAKLSASPNTPLSWSATSGQDIIADMLDAVGISDYVLSGWATFGNVEAVTLGTQDSYASLLSDLDEIERCVTSEGPGGRIYRIQRVPVPSGSAAFSFVEGIDLFGSPSRDQDISDVKNRVVVKGHPGASILRTRQGTSPYISGYRTWSVESPLIDTIAMADEVARLSMLECNRRVDKHSFSVLGNPYVIPGTTVSITAPGYGIAEATNYTVASVAHEVGREGYMTNLELEGGVGDAGYSTGSPPIADFTYQVERETFPSEGTLYFVFCTDASRDYDDPPSALARAWANNRNADTGSDTRYATYFTAAQIEAGATVTLVVEDPQGNTDAISKTITVDTSQTLRDYFVAFGDSAKASADSGLNWQTWLPGGGVSVISTPRYGPEGIGLFGLSDGRLVMTEDYLRSAPSTLHTFGSGVNAIWVYYGDLAQEWWVGTAGGSLYRTTDAGSSWTAIHTFAAAIVDVHRGWDNIVRVMSGRYEWIAWAPWTTWQVWHTFGTQALRIAIGDAIVRGNEYAPDHILSGIDLTGTHIAVVGEHAGLGEMPGLPDDVVDVRAISQDANRPRIHMVVRDGRTYYSDYTTSRQPVVQTTDLPGSTAVNYLINDETVSGLIVAVDENTGVWKSHDSGTTWKSFLPTSGGNRGKQIGRSAKGWVVKPADGSMVLVSGTDGANPLVQRCANVFDPGADWVDLSAGLPGGLWAFDVQVDSGNTNVAYLRTGVEGALSETGGVWKSADWKSTGTWSEVLSISQVRDVVNDSYLDADILNLGIEALQVRAGVIYALVAAYTAAGMGGTRHSFYVFRSTNGGSSWSAVEAYTIASPYLTAVARYSLAVNPVDEDEVYLQLSNSTMGGALWLFRSTDGGATWGSGPLITRGGATQAHLVFPIVGVPSGSTQGLWLPEHISEPGPLYHKVNGAWSSFGSHQGPINEVWMAPRNQARVAKFTGGRFKVSGDAGATWGDGASLASTRVPHAAAAFQATAQSAPVYYVGCDNTAGLGVALLTTTDFLTLTIRGPSTWSTNVKIRGVGVNPGASA